MAIKVINVGSKANSGGGDALRDAMIKINDNFAELYDRTGGDVASSVIGADSTVLVDGANSSLNADALTGTAPAGVVTFPNISNTPTTVAGYGITDAYTKAQSDQKVAIEINDFKTELGSGGAGAIDASVLTGSLPAIDGSALTGISAGVATSLDGDMTGSVYADDSTLLVDGVAGTINAGALTGALPAIDGSALTGVLTAGGDFEGNLSGSVFADDSTILIDGTTGQIVGPVTTSTLTLNSENITLGNGSTAGTEAVSIGKGTNAGNYSVAIGNNAGNTTQDQGAVAIGSEAGETNQGPRAIAIGNYAGETDQDYSAIAIGYEAGETTQGGKAIAIGQFAGQTNQAQGNVAIGSGAGNTDQGSVAVAIGEAAGGINQSASAVAIGQNAGSTGQGEWAVAIGRSAGKVNQADNSIVINASGGDLNNTTANSFVVKPIRNAQGVTTLMYNETTGEITHSTSADLLSGSSQSIDIVAADSTLLVDSSNGTLNSSALTKPVSFADDEKAIFGTGDDLQIWHNGASSIIQNSTGELQLRGNTIRLLNAATTKDFAFFNNNGSVDLYYDGNKKFETTSDGISVTDHIALADDGELRVGTDNDMQIYHSGTSGFIKNTTGTLILQGSTVRIQDAGSTQTAISAADGIATLLFENSAKLATSTDGVAVTGRITGLTDPTAAQDAATKAYVDASIISGGGGGGAAFTNIGVGADDSAIKSIGEGESFLILGGTGITTASDAEGNITITGFDGAFGSLSGKPTTLAGYGITDAASLNNMAPTGAVDFTGATSIDFNTVTINNLEFADISSKPTTLAGYGITDANTNAVSAVTAADLDMGGNKVLFANVYSNLVDLPSASTYHGMFAHVHATGLAYFAHGGAWIPLASAATTLAGYGITDAFDGAFGSLSGTPTTLGGYGITDAATTGTETTFTKDVHFDRGVEEKFQTLTGQSGVVAHNWNDGHVFYHTTPAGDITANFINVNLTAEYATNVTIIINQGATPYIITAVQIAGAAQTINWQGGSAPTGNANGIDSFSFTILNDGGSYVVLGQMVDFT